MKIYAFADEASPMIDGQIAAMLRNELDGLEIRGVDGTNISAISLSEAKAVHRKLADANLRVWSIGSPIGKIWITKGDYQEHLAKFRHTLEIAQILEAENLRMFSFYIPQDLPHSQCRDMVISRLQEMVSIAEGTGISLCHENEKEIYGDTAERCLDILTAVPQLKNVFDPANFIQCQQDTAEAWKLLQHRTHYLHIKDALPDGNVVPAGKGVGNLPEIIKSFRDMGGTALTIEPHLTVFEGFSELENNQADGKAESFVYPSGDAAFDAACNALKALL